MCVRKSTGANTATHKARPKEKKQQTTRSFFFILWKCRKVEQKKNPKRSKGHYLRWQPHQYHLYKKTFFFCFWRWARSSVTKRKQTTSSFFFFFCLPLISLRFIDHDSDTSKQHGRLGGAGVESPRTIGIIGHFTFLTKQMTCSNGEMAWDSVFRTFFLLFRKATAAVFTQRKKIKPVPAWVSFWYLYCKERERHCASVYLRRACPVYRLSPVWGLLPLLRVFILDLDIYIYFLFLSFFLFFPLKSLHSFSLACLVRSFSLSLSPYFLFVSDRNFKGWGGA